MPSNEHRNVRKKHFCPGCEHFHPAPNPLNPPNIVGVCLLRPPTAFVVGMAAYQPAVVADPKTPPQQIPIIRGYFPPVSETDTCDEWTPAAEGEA